MADWQTNRMAESGRMVALQEQTHAIAQHPLFMGHGDWPVGLQPLGGLTFLFEGSGFGRSGEAAENLLDLLATEDGFFICDEDTGEPIGVEVDGLRPPYRDSWYLLTVL